MPHLCDECPCYCVHTDLKELFPRSDNGFSQSILWLAPKGWPTKAERARIYSKMWTVVGKLFCASSQLFNSSKIFFGCNGYRQVDKGPVIAGWRTDKYAFRCWNFNLPTNLLLVTAWFHIHNTEDPSRELPPWWPYTLSTHVTTLSQCHWI